MSRFYSPLRFPGGKGCIFPFVSRVFYENRLLGFNYAEPYAGGAGLALRLLIEEYVSNIYINDLDESIYSFWKAILNEPVRFCDWIENVKVTMDNWEYYKTIHDKIDFNDSFEIAKSTFFLNRTNISGVIKGGPIGGKKQTGKYKIDARFNKTDLIKRIHKISCFRKRINISKLDGISFIKKINKRKEKIFIYLDPPYFKKANDLYMNFYSKKDHVKLAKYINKIKNKCMISYDNDEFILNLYAEKEKILYKLSQSTSNRVGNEVLIFLNQLKYIDSLNNLNAPAKL